MRGLPVVCDRVAAHLGGEGQRLGLDHLFRMDASQPQALAASPPASPVIRKVELQRAGLWPRPRFSLRLGGAFALGLSARSRWLSQ